jgi:phenylalanyl-tRNA synthetase beta chain
MGGADSEIEPTTTKLALESAQFNGTIIRQAAQKMGVRTDGSTRHEKGLGYSFAEDGFWRAVQLLQDHAGAILASPVIDTNPQAPAATVIELSRDYMNRLIGLTIETDQMNQWLESLGCDVSTINDDTYEIIVPLHRTDLRTAQDIIEEVARMYGYDAIPEIPLLGSLQPPVTQPDFTLGNKIIQWLVGWGVTEIYNYSFYSITDATQAGLVIDEHIEMLNPMNPNQQLLRQTGLVNLLHNVARNTNAGYKAFSLGEYGHLYFKHEEITVIEGVVIDPENVFYKAKGFVEAILQAGFLQYEFRDMQYFVNGKCVAEVSLVPNTIATKFDVTIPVAHYRIYLQPLSEVFPSAYSQKTISAYPAIDLDISISVPAGVLWDDIRSSIQTTAGELLQHIEVFDVYEGNLGIRMWLQSTERTLQMKEAETLRENIIKTLVDRFKITHRY